MTSLPRLVMACATLCLILLMAACPALAQPKHIPPGQAKKMGPGYKSPGPPPHAPAHGYRNKYRFYPEQDLCYDLERDRYFHYEDGEWRRYDQNPLTIQLGPFFTIEMDTDRPYKHYREHKRQFRILP